MITLVNVSSAFDIIDHSILEHCFHTVFLFTDIVFQLFSTYQTDGILHVSIKLFLCFCYCKVRCSSNFAFRPCIFLHVNQTFVHH